MSLVPNQSYANEATPLFAPASVLSALTPTEWLPGPYTVSLTPGGLIVYIVVNPPYFTTAGKYYDICVLAKVDVVSGTSTGIDQFRIVLNIDGTPFNSTLGSWACDYRVGAETTTYTPFTVRLLCTNSNQLSLGLECAQVGGSTADYEVGIASVLISEVP